MHDVTIKKCLNGLLVKVGCTYLVFNSRNEFIKEFRKYLNNPEKMIEEYQKKYGCPGPQLEQAPGQANVTRATAENRVELTRPI